MVIILNRLFFTKATKNKNKNKKFIVDPNKKMYIQNTKKTNTLLYNTK